MGHYGSLHEFYGAQVPFVFEKSQTLKQKQKKSKKLGLFKTDWDLGSRKSHVITHNDP